MKAAVGVILAGGLSIRMGQPKQLLPYGDGTVLDSVVDAARASKLERICVVLGAYEPEIRYTVGLHEAWTVVNPEPERGNLSSLQAAAKTVGDAAVVLLMGDMPGVEPEVIDRHLEAWSDDPAWLRTTTYADGVGHPFMLSPELIAGLDELSGPKPLWALTQDERTRTLEVSGPMPVDVDTPEDYTEALARDSAEGAQ